MTLSHYSESKKLSLVYSIAFFIAIGIVLAVFLPKYSSAEGGGGVGWQPWDTGGGGTTYAPTWQGVRGYASSTVIGPISLNCINTGTCPPSPNDYSVIIDIGRRETSGSGAISGIAWNDIVGNISFPSFISWDGVRMYMVPMVDWSNGNVTGWAKINSCPVGNPSCIKWISLSCQNDSSCATSNYGVKINKKSGLFSGYAWGGDPANGGSGWIDFSGATANFPVLFGCYIPEQYGRNIIEYSATSVLSPAKIKQLPLPYIPLKKGAYTSIMATYDDHSSGNDAETVERWTQSTFLCSTPSPSSFFNTGRTPDLPSYASYAEYDMSLAPYAQHKFIDLKCDGPTTPHTLLDLPGLYSDTSMFANGGPEVNPDGTLTQTGTFTPACIAYDYACPLRYANDNPIPGMPEIPIVGRTIIDFTDVNGGIPRGVTLEPGGTASIHNINLPKGTYKVTLASYDNNATQASLGTVNDSVGWRINRLGTPSQTYDLLPSPTIDYLPKKDDFLISSQSQIITTPTDAVQLGIVAENTAGRDKVTALCAAFDKVEVPTVALTTTPPQAGGAILNYGDTGTITWDITGSYDQCYFDSTMPSGARHTAWNTLSPTLTEFISVYPPPLTYEKKGIYSYELACSYNGNKGATSTASFTLNDPKPLSVSLSPLSQSANVGATNVVFSWLVNDDGYVSECSTKSDGIGIDPVKVSEWATKFNGMTNSNMDRSGTFNVGAVPTGVISFTLTCKDGNGANVQSSAIINTPPQCSDAPIDNDGDGFIDQEDRGCWTNPRNKNSYNPADNNEEGENVCQVNTMCEVKYGENPFNCPADCKVQKYQDQ